MDEKHFEYVNTERGQKRTVQVEMVGISFDESNLADLVFIPQLFVVGDVSPERLPWRWRHAKPGVLPPDPFEAREVLRRMEENGDLSPYALVLIEPDVAFEDEKSWHELFRDPQFKLPALVMTQEIYDQLARLSANEKEMALFLASIQIPQGGLILSVKIQEKAKERWLYLWV